MTSTPVRLGLVGAGAIAHLYVTALSERSFARIVGVADPRRAAADSLAAAAGCVGYASTETLLESSGCDAVIVCTPPATHARISREVIDRGLPVLCEKPLTLGIDQARDLVAYAARADVLLGMASKFRYVADLILTKELLASGTIGTPVVFENHFSSKVDMRDRWHSDPSVGGGGVLIDNGTHSVEIARFLFGPISEVLAVEATRVQSLDVEDTAQLLVRAATGVQGVINLSWSLDSRLPYFLRVLGTDGILEAGWTRSRYRTSSRENWVRFGPGYDKMAAITGPVRNFSQAVRHEGDFEITADDALASVAVIDAAYASMRDRCWVRTSG